MPSKAPAQLLVSKTSGPLAYGGRHMGGKGRPRQPRNRFCAQESDDKQMRPTLMRSAPPFSSWSSDSKPLPAYLHRQTSQTLHTQADGCLCFTATKGSWPAKHLFKDTC